MDGDTMLAVIRTRLADRMEQREAARKTAEVMQQQAKALGATLQRLNWEIESDETLLVALGAGPGSDGGVDGGGAGANGGPGEPEGNRVDAAQHE